MLVTRASSAFTGQSRGGGCIGADPRQIFSHSVEPRSDKAVVLQTLWCFYLFVGWWLQSKRTRERGIISAIILQRDRRLVKPMGRAGDATAESRWRAIGEWMTWAGRSSTANLPLTVVSSATCSLWSVTQRSCFRGLDALIALAPTRRSHTSSEAWLEGNRALVEPLSMLIPALETWHEPTVTRLFVSLFFFSAGC